MRHEETVTRSSSDSFQNVKSGWEKKEKRLKGKKKKGNKEEREQKNKILVNPPSLTRTITSKPTAHATGRKRAWIGSAYIKGEREEGLG